MPFTVSHAVAALPFRRTRIVMSALVVGTMAPDFEYFVRLSPQSRVAHEWPGVLIVTLPMSLAVLWMYHAIVKRPLVAHLPVAVQQRLAGTPEPFRFGGLRRFALILLSLALGIATHILWDSFTHRDSWGYDRLPFLQDSVALPFVGERGVFNLLQHSSTVLGLAALLLWGIYWFRTTPPHPGASRDHMVSAPQKGLSIVLIATIALLAGLARAYVLIGVPEGIVPLSRFLAFFAVTTITVLWLELLACGLFWAHHYKLQNSTTL